MGRRGDSGAGSGRGTEGTAALRHPGLEEGTAERAGAEPAGATGSGGDLA